MKNRMKNRGFTLMELLIVVAILAVLMMMAISLIPRQLEKARDGKRKSDLQKIKIAFEDYYNDNGCYPPSDILENCGGAELSPYLASIPCDPKDRSYYIYLPFDNSGGAGTCDGFRVWANLEKNDDPVVAQIKCDGAIGCGAFAYFETDLGLKALEYNYGVSEGVPVLAGNYGDEIHPGLTSGFCCAGVCNVWNDGLGSCTDGPYIDYPECVAVSSCTN